MNANSRRILERKQLRAGSETQAPDGIVSGKIVSGEAVRAAPLRNTERVKPNVPRGTLVLNNVTRRGSEADSQEISSFAPTINKRSHKMAQAKREGKIEDHLLKQAELSRKKKAELETKKAGTN